MFSITYHPALSNKIYEILKEAQVILQADEEHKKLFPSIPLVSFRRAKTLQDTLVRAKLPSLESEGGSCKGCKRSNCQVDTFLDTRETFSNSDQSRTFNLRKGALNCNSKFVVYRLSCKTCNMQYIGSAKTKFRKRINNYKSQLGRTVIKEMLAQFIVKLFPKVVSLNIFCKIITMVCRIGDFNLSIVLKMRNNLEKESPFGNIN